jgi:hypothetical protein
VRKPPINKPTDMSVKNKVTACATGILIVFAIIAKDLFQLIKKGGPNTRPDCLTF